MKNIIKVTFISIILLVITSLPVLSYSPYLDQTILIYNTRQRCELCHISTKLNVFGKDFKELLYKNQDLIQTLKEIGELDSDKDGYTNKDEIQSISLPGDKVSTPVTVKNNEKVELLKNH